MSETHSVKWYAMVMPGADTTEARRQRRVKPPDTRREEILAGALRLFHEKGFAETTVQDIADTAEVAAGTLYNYFRSKTQMLRAIHEAYHEEMHARLQKVATALLGGLQDGSLSYADATARWVDAIAGYMLDKTVETAVICRYLPATDEPFQEERKFVEFIAAVIAAGRDAGHLYTTDPEMTAHLLVASLRWPFTQSLVYGYPPDLDRLVAQAKELFRKAMAPEA